MKKKKIKIGNKIAFLLDVEPYKQTAIIICNGEFGDAIKIFRKNRKNANAQETLKHIEERKDMYLADSKPSAMGGYLYTKLPHGYVMMFNHQDSWVDTVGTIVHESVHLAHYILHSAGVALANESEEAYTYLVEDIVEKILKKIY